MELLLLCVSWGLSCFKDHSVTDFHPDFLGGLQFRIVLEKIEHYAHCNTVSVIFFWPNVWAAAKDRFKFCTEGCLSRKCSTIAELICTITQREQRRSKDSVDRVQELLRLQIFSCLGIPIGIFENLIESLDLLSNSTNWEGLLGSWK